MRQVQPVKREIRLEVWMLSKARLSLANRGVTDLPLRIRRLEEYEQWAKCQQLNIETLVDSQTWKRYYTLQDDILTKMREAQEVAVTLAKQVQSNSARLLSC